MDPIAEFQRKIQQQTAENVRARRKYNLPDMDQVGHCVAQALALTDDEFVRVTAKVRAAIAAKKLTVNGTVDSSGALDVNALPPPPPLPSTRQHDKRTGVTSQSRVDRFFRIVSARTAAELTLVIQYVRAARPLPKP